MVTFAEFKKSFVVQILISYAFLVSGLITNVFQLLTLIFIWPFDRILYRRINNYLAILLWGS